MVQESPQREGPRPSNLLEDVRIKKLSSQLSAAQLNAGSQQFQNSAQAQYQNVSLRRARSTSYSGSQAMSFQNR
jgi:hypothetical protein